MKAIKGIFGILIITVLGFFLAGGRIDYVGDGFIIWFPWE